MQQTRRRAALTSVLIASLALLGMGGSAVADESLNTRLKGYEEVPAVSSAASGRFKAKIDKASGTINYEISYSGLEGDVRQSHIHIGQRGVNGGIDVGRIATDQDLATRDIDLQAHAQWMRRLLREPFDDVELP